MRRLSLVPFAALAFFAATAAAEDSKTYTIPTKEVWKAGDVASRTETQHQIQKQKVTGAQGAVLQDDTKEETTEYSLVIKVQEVDGAGDYSKATVYFTTWSRKEGGVEDTSLTGKHVEFNGTGAARTATVVGGGKPSDKAAAWLKKEFAKDAETEGGGVLAPAHALAIGETWTPDFAAVAKMFGKGEMKLVAEKSKVTGTLVSVEGNVAHVTVDFDLQAGPMDGPAGPMEWKEGGKFQMKAEIQKDLTPGAHAETASMTGGFKGTMIAGPATVVVDVTTENHGESKSGGEMPPVPEVK